MNQQNIKEKLIASHSTQILILAFAEMDKPFKDNINMIETALLNLEGKSQEYQRILKETIIGPEKNDWIYLGSIEQSLRNLTTIPVLEHRPFFYELGPKFQIFCNIVREINYEKGIPYFLLEKFAVDFKEELSKLGGIK